MTISHVVPYHAMQDAVALDTVSNTMDDFMRALQQASKNGNEQAAYELERLQDRKNYNNAKRWLRIQQTRLLTRAAGDEIRRHINALHLRHEYNDVMPTHRRLKIDRAVVDAVKALPLWAIAVKHDVQITLDTVDSRETLHALTVRGGQPQYCLRITPTSEPSTKGEHQVYLNI
jgi:diaminopimelate decarboxylase